MKCTANVLSNIKPVSGGAAIAQLPIGGWVFGELSPTGTDIINFSHFYRSNGERVELLQNGNPVLCKVWIGSNSITDVLEDETDPPPVEPPPAVIRQTRYSYDGGKTYSAWETWKKQ